MQQYDVILLAGGRSPWLKAYCGTEFRSLAPLHGKRMLDYILDALLKSGRVRRIILAAPSDALPHLDGTLPAGVRICASDGDLPSTSLAALRALGKDATPMILAVCDDIPLINAASIDDFLDRCEQAAGKEVYYPIIPKEACLTRFPDAQRTYGKLTDGIFTGGNIMLISQSMISEKQDLGREIFSMRKSPLKLAGWLGWSFILKAIFRKLSIAQAEARFEAIMRTPAKAIITDHAEIGMDIDKLSDLHLAEKYLSK